MRGRVAIIEHFRENGHSLRPAGEKVARAQAVTDEGDHGGASVVDGPTRRSAPTACHDSSCRGGPLRSRWRRRSLTDAAYPLRVLCRPAMTTASTTLTLIRHGFAMPPSPWQGEGKKAHKKAAALVSGQQPCFNSRPCRTWAGPGRTGPPCRSSSKWRIGPASPAAGRSVPSWTGSPHPG